MRCSNLYYFISGTPDYSQIYIVNSERFYLSDQVSTAKNPTSAIYKRVENGARMQRDAKAAVPPTAGFLGMLPSGDLWPSARWNADCAGLTSGCLGDDWMLCRGQLMLGFLQFAAEDTLFVSSGHLRRRCSRVGNSALLLRMYCIEMLITVLGCSLQC